MRHSFYATRLIAVLMLALFMSIVGIMPTPAVAAPKIQVESKEFSFSPTVEGKEVVHDYIIKNSGDEELQILNVKPGWGCTAANYTRQIPPGGSGTIQIKANTSGYGGKTLHKSIRVSTNDPEQREFTLKIEGKVIPFADISNTRVRLKGNPGEVLTETVTIREIPGNAFSILGVTALQGKDISFKLEKNEKVKTRNEFKLEITNKKSTPGRYYDRITVKTDSEIRPELHITVYGQILNPAENNKDSSEDSDTL